MKALFAIFALTVLLFAIGCSKPQVIGRVVLDDEGQPQVQFGKGKVGGCAFVNAPHEGDDVVISNHKTGECEAIPHQEK